MRKKAEIGKYFPELLDCLFVCLAKASETGHAGSVGRTASAED